MYKVFSLKFSLIVVSVIFALFLSCRRNKDCRLIVNVVDTSNAPVVSAQVHVYPNQTGGTLQGQDQTNITDASGNASFTFKLPAILKVDVTPPAPYGYATGLVQLEESKTTTKAITVP